MKLSELADASGARAIGGSLTEDKTVNSLAYHSDKVVPGSLFFALKGSRTDGTKYIRQAIEKGAAAIAFEENEKDAALSAEEVRRLRAAGGSAPDVAFLACKDLRKSMACAAARFYGEPSKRLLTIGVTGTKGKTGTSFMIRNILEAAGVKTGIIGTVYSGFGENLLPSARTTPESVDLQRMLREMADAGCGAAVIEVSSQGLMHRRANCVDFSAGVFTNLSPDHVGPGEHDSYEEYRFWKSTFFHRCPFLVMNGDDAETDFMLAGASPEKVVFYGRGPRCGLRIEEYKAWRERARLGIEYMLAEEYAPAAGDPSAGGHTAEGPSAGGFSRSCGRESIRLPLVGGFNAYNSAAAIGAVRPLGVPWETVKKALSETTVPGRTEVVSGFDDFTVMVDYAHNGLALTGLLESLRAYGPSRLTVVFGCGGERDRHRRSEMGRAASRLADKIIITADNPRGEPPEEITAEIYAAVEKKEKATIIEDREQAIEAALADGLRGEIIVIAGRGHEAYQIIGKEKRRLSDAETVRRLAETLAKARKA